MVFNSDGHHTRVPASSIFQEQPVSDTKSTETLVCCTHGTKNCEKCAGEDRGERFWVHTYVQADVARTEINGK